MRAPLMLTPKPWHEWQQQQERTAEEEQPAVPGEVARALHDEQRHHECNDRNEAPRGLQAGEFVVEAGDHHEADAVQQCRQREQGAVCATCHESDDDVGAQQHAEQDRDEEDDARWDLGVRAEGGHGVRGAGDQRRHHQQRQLGRSSAASEW